jgi:hypothetical protein
MLSWPLTKLNDVNCGTSDSNEIVVIIIIIVVAVDDVDHFMWRE